MTGEADRFREAKRLFAEAAGRPADERDRWLEGACGGDQSLLAEVKSLLAADAAAEPAVPLPERIGDFRIVRRIGAGGMGTVYEAEQASPRRRVALKVMTPVLADEESARRFRYETEVLGRLDHPGIARIYSAGVHEGRPWFAMELVDGADLTKYARSHDLGRKQRLALLEKVCEAVHEAHIRGIVHRDLKPGNILVDRNGQPKLLDFGLAKLVDGETRMQTLATQAGQLLGTVPYMAPEQVSMDPSAIDLRTDVYALGVVAYELLSGRHPLDLAGHSLAEALLRVRDSDAPRLGTLHTQWRGDVETIVAKALEKEKDRRYASAGEMGADIGRYLRDQPIVARPASTVYQLRKFVRRHRTLVAGLAATFLALVAGVAVSTTYALKAARERDEARRQKERADTKAVTASRALEFMVDVFKSEDPFATQGEPPTTREVLERATRRLEEQLRDQPALQAALALSIGKIHTSIGDSKAARPLLERALEAARRIEQDDPAPLYEALRQLAAQLEEDHEMDRARLLRTELLDRARREEGADDLLGAALLGMSRHHAWRNEPDKAEEIYRDVLADGRFATFADILWLARMDLADIVRTRGRNDEAEELLRVAATEAERALGPRSESALAVQLSLAEFLMGVRKFADALKAYERIADTYLPVLDADHGKALNIRARFGVCLAANGKADEAVAMLADCVARARKTLGEKHVSFAVLLAQYVDVCTQADKLEGLEPLACELVDLQRAIVGDRPDYRLNGYLTTLGNVLMKQDEPRRAIPCYLECIDIARRSAGIESVPGAFALIFALQAHVAAQAHEEALPLARELIGVQEKVFGRESGYYALGSVLAGTVLLRSGDAAAAEGPLRAGRDLYRTVGPASNEMGMALEGLVDALVALGRKAEAIEAAREHVALAEKHYKTEDPRLAAARKRLEELERPSD